MTALTACMLTSGVACKGATPVAATDNAPATAPETIIAPPTLQPGDKIAIITPSTSSSDAKIRAAIDTMKAWGYQPVVMPHTYGRAWGTYTATHEQRAQSIIQALEDPHIKAILCSRGGYGANHLLELISPELIRKNPKWVIGFSDISALQALWLSAGVESVHGPMGGHMLDEPAGDPALKYLRQLLATGKMPTYSSNAGHKYNHPGTGTGMVIGGNMIVLNNLAQTPWDEFEQALQRPCILFIEDVGEKIYAVERMFVRLHQAGILKNLKGLVLGKYSEYEGDANFKNMEEMFHANLVKWGFYGADSQMPIVYDFPVGHVTANFPLVVGAQATLVVKPGGAWTLSVQ